MIRNFRYWRHLWWFNYCKKKMIENKKNADYNLYRHDEAIASYNMKKERRDAAISGNGFHIADENADFYAHQYNTFWTAYIKFKHKVEILEPIMQEKLKRDEINN